ncbi:MAG TPA: hypothetical protein VL122_02485 [Nitrospirota bacterium]|nr:hypothetical protein [Nitrospirota bacterium]
MRKAIGTECGTLDGVRKTQEALKNSNTAAEALNSGTRKQRSKNSICGNRGGTEGDGHKDRDQSPCRGAQTGLIK